MFDNLFSTCRMALDAENPLVLDVLHASKTAYSHFIDEPIKDYPLVVGSSTVLIAGLQVR